MMICTWCGDEFQAESERRRWCSRACEAKAYRERRKKRVAV
jgi:hypothetical protein